MCESRSAKKPRELRRLGLILGFLENFQTAPDNVEGLEWNMNVVRLSMVCIRARARRAEADQAYALDYNVFSAPDPASSRKKQRH